MKIEIAVFFLVGLLLTLYNDLNNEKNEKEELEAQVAELKNELKISENENSVLRILANEKGGKMINHDIAEILINLGNKLKENPKDLMIRVEVKEKLNRIVKDMEV